MYISNLCLYIYIYIHIEREIKFLKCTNSWVHSCIYIMNSAIKILVVCFQYLQVWDGILHSQLLFVDGSVSLHQSVHQFLTLRLIHTPNLLKLLTISLHKMSDKQKTPSVTLLHFDDWVVCFVFVFSQNTVNVPVYHLVCMIFGRKFGS